MQDGKGKKIWLPVFSAFPKTFSEAVFLCVIENLECFAGDIMLQYKYDFLLDSKWNQIPILTLLPLSLNSWHLH